MSFSFVMSVLLDAKENLAKSFRALLAPGLRAAIFSSDLLTVMLLLIYVSLYNQGPDKRGHVVADTLLSTTNVSPFARPRNICCGHKICVQDRKNVSDFVQKHFVSETNVSQFAQPKKHHGQQCVPNNVSSFTPRAF